MTNQRKTLLNQFYTLFIEPRKQSDFVTDQNSRLLSTVLLIFILFGIFSIIPHVLISGSIQGDPYNLIALLTSSILICPYILSRYQYISLSVLISSILMSSIAWIYALYLDPGDYLTLDYLVLPITMGVFFQKKRGTIFIILFNLILLLSLPWFSNSYTLENIINYSILFNILIVTIFYTLHSFLLNSEKRYQQKLRSLDSKSREREKMDSLIKLSRGIGHDFNNILSVIDNSIELYNNERSNFDIYYKDIHEASKQAKSLIDHLLTFTRNYEFDRQIIDVNTVIEEMHYVLTQLGSPSVSIKLKLSTKDMLIKINVSQFKQLILNLVTNAIEAIKRSGTINIESYLEKSSEQQRVIIEIEDNGIGIPSSILDHVFEPYFTTKDQGTGIGLATVKDIVESNHGEVNISSEVGHGTTVLIMFPYCNRLN